ncbi:MAG: 1-acyl-sn-glycerol-3-phosphate acyltransferase [Acidipila sp.]|nr:1-acyl-sn-glycerol-3-phosphate acyltransferase [Acidipila sp.]
MRAVIDALGYLRSLAVTVPLIYLLTIFWGTLSLLCSLANSSGIAQHTCARLWARCLLAVCGVRLSVRGAEHLEAGRTYIFAANHQSYLDIPVIFALMPANFRIMAKGSLFHIPFIGWHLRRSGHMPVARGNPRRAARSLLEAASHVRRGTPVFIFPEGGRSPDGRFREFKPGTFLLAIKSGAAVVPVTINGTRAVLPMRSWHVRPGRVELILHAPIETAGLKSDAAHSLAESVRAVIAADFDESSTLATR